MSVTGQVFLKLLTPKDVLIWLHNSACFSKPFRSEGLNESPTFLKSSEKYFYPTFPSFLAQLSRKKLFLIRSEILWLLANTLTANYEYSGSNRENLRLRIQNQLQKKT